MSNLKVKRQVSFSLNFASLFNFMRGNSSVLFQLKRYMIFTKGAHQSAKFQTFACSGEISPNLYFDRLLLLAVSKVSAKKVQRSYIYLMILKSDTKFEEKPICCFKNKVQKICTLIGLFRAKCKTFDLKRKKN